jgi:glucose-6-phosphate isomerase
MNQKATQTMTHTPSPLNITWLHAAPTLSNPATIVEARKALKAFEHQYNTMPFLKLPERRDDMPAIRAAAETIIAQSDTLVLVGIGGSSLGAEAVCALAEVDAHVYLEVMDNPDPHSFEQFMHHCDADHTSWIFISKSGGTLETVTQTMIVLKWLEEEIGREGIKERCLIITEPNDSALQKIAKHYDIPTQEHDPELGGRWTCMSNVGLIAAAACGVDIEGIREGAAAMLHHTLHTDIADNQALQGALYGVENAKAGRSTHAIMPYADRLDYTAQWCRQLISESLGKNGKGITPLAALGSVDQHSMLQLLLDGPNDKYFTIITAAQEGRGPKIPADLCEIAGLNYLKNTPLGTVLSAFQHGTIGSLKEYKQPLRTIALPKIDAYHLGALLMYFMIETVLIAELIGVDAFDQPAVEDGKIRAKAFLGA